MQFTFVHLKKGLKALLLYCCSMCRTTIQPCYLSDDISNKRGQWPIPPYICRILTQRVVCKHVCVCGVALCRQVMDTHKSSRELLPAFSSCSDWCCSSGLLHDTQTLRDAGINSYVPRVWSGFFFLLSIFYFLSHRKSWIPDWRVCKAHLHVCCSDVFNVQWLRPELFHTILYSPVIWHNCCTSAPTLHVISSFSSLQLQDVLLDSNNSQAKKTRLMGSFSLSMILSGPFYLL